MTRTYLLNHLIQKHNLKSYCELGTQNRAQNFDKIQCADKFCVDIDENAKADFVGSTDDFFKTLNRKFDLYFIDASHIAEDVKRDFENCLKYSNENSFIVLHDCNPQYEQHTIVPRQKPTGHWNGSVYKFACELGLYYKKFNVVNIDNGCGVWNNAGGDIMKDSNGWWPQDWATFNKNREYLLNLISWDEFIKL
jgi:hypothetical protein